MVSHFRTTPLIIALCFLFTFCTSNDSINTQVSSLCSKPIDLCSIDTLIDSEKFVVSADYKFVTYFDSLVCSSCVLSDLDSWSVFIDSLVFMNIPVLFIFEPTDESYEFLNFIRRRKFPHASIVFDCFSSFSRSNTHLPTDYFLNSFLLDKDNNVVLVGNPIENEKIKELIFKKISE